MISNILGIHFLQVLEGDYTITYEPSRGYLEPREEMSVKLTFTGHKKVLKCGGDRIGGRTIDTRKSVHAVSREKIIV